MSINSNLRVNDLFQQSATLPFSRVHIGNDTKSQLQVIVAIHSTVLGPALGGCRLLNYSSTSAALTDVLHLARGMSYKAAFNHLSYGGGKAVILAPAKIVDRHALMVAYGDFIESLNGQFITAIDSGTGTEDMDIIAQRTSHVVCTSNKLAGTGNPSPHTARGVLRGIQAAVKYALKQDQLEGLHVLIQGVGHVGYHLARYLHERGAKLSVSDINQQALHQCQDEFAATVIAPEEVYATECDIFSPCARGQIINADSMRQLKTKIVAGAANNQLSEGHFGDLLRKKGILYAPDYVINSGGLLQIACIDNGEDLAQAIDNLYDKLLTLFERSDKQDQATNIIADQMAEQYLNQHQCDEPIVRRRKQL